MIMKRFPQPRRTLLPIKGDTALRQPCPRQNCPRRSQHDRRMPRHQLQSQETKAQLYTEEEGPAKFQPFVPVNAMQQRMLQFRRSYAAGAAGTLLVQPVTQPWTPAGADVLTDTFAESMGYVSMYTNFLRRNIRKYLETHMVLPPKAVVLVALLVPPPPEEEASSAIASLDVPAQQRGEFAANSYRSDLETVAQQPMQGSSAAGAGGDAEHLQSNPSAAAAAVEMGPGPSGAALIGAVEVSFAESTRSKYMTLNPPPDRPYLCNMAIGAEWRGRGFGAQLLEAAEDLVIDVGESCVFLHLRLQDAPAAALYRKAGYKPVATDSFLVQLIGLDRRYLMRKELAPRGNPLL